MFKRADFGVVKAIPAGTEFARGWDFASTADDPSAARTAGVKIGRKPDGRFLVAHCLAEHASPARVRTLLKNTADQDKAAGGRCVTSLPQDPGQAGKSQVQQFVALLAGHVVKSSPESGDKVNRAEPFAAQVEAGNVDLLEGSWNEMFLEEVEVFPAGELKDIVDASSRAFNELAAKPQTTSQEVRL